MPIFDFINWSQTFGGLLRVDGPVIPVEISMPVALEEWCVQNNFAVPPPVTGYALVDTGASISGVHEPILSRLSIVPIDAIPLSTSSGTGRAFVYPTKIAIPPLNISAWPISRVVGSQLSWKTSDGKEVIMLLGRDLLQFFLLVYNGKLNCITLAC